MKRWQQMRGEGMISEENGKTVWRKREKWDMRKAKTTWVWKRTGEHDMAEARLGKNVRLDGKRWYVRRAKNSKDRKRKYKIRKSKTTRSMHGKGSRRWHGIIGEEIRVAVRRKTMGWFAGKASTNEYIKAKRRWRCSEDYEENGKAWKKW